MLTLYILIAVGAGVYVIDDLSRSFSFLNLILIVLIAIWVRLGNLLRAVVASNVFGRESLQWTDVD